MPLVQGTESPGARLCDTMVYFAGRGGLKVTAPLKPAVVHFDCAWFDCEPTRSITVQNGIGVGVGFGVGLGVGLGVVFGVGFGVTRGVGLGWPTGFDVGFGAALAPAVGPSVGLAPGASDAGTAEATDGRTASCVAAVVGPLVIPATASRRSRPPRATTVATSTAIASPATMNGASLDRRVRGRFASGCAAVRAPGVADRGGADMVIARPVSAAVATRAVGAPPSVIRLIAAA